MNKRLVLLSLAWMCSCLCGFSKNIKVERWQRFEQVFRASVEGNPFVDATLSATFWQEGGDSIAVEGFCDGTHRFVVRFMPEKVGKWNFVTQSNVDALDGKRGSFECVEAAVGNHGMVRVGGKHHFAYADGTTYYPVGTTAYDWIHMSEEVRRQACQSLKEAQFNKLRMCVLPKYYALCKEEPELLPFEVKGQEGEKPVFDLTRPDPSFFKNLENCIDSLAQLGIEADVILFHPYDKGHWGFDSMPMDANLQYIRYVVARLSSFHNVWWSLANEYDYVKAKSESGWFRLIEEVNARDPYRHLCSIHGSTATYFPYYTDGLTHTSIQDEAPVMEAGRAPMLRNIYAKPVVLDEVCYEGNLAQRWGRLSGEEMLYRIWNGLIAGVYVTHGECYQYHKGDFDTIFWAKGGKWRGESWKRIPFVRELLADLPHPLQMADVSRDDVTATAGDGYYLVYFGKQMQDSWLFNLPAKNAGYEVVKPGTKYKVEIIDTWDMTVTECPDLFEVGAKNDYRHYDKDFRKIRLPLKPYLMLRIKKYNP